MAEASRGRWLRSPASTSRIIQDRSSELKEPPTLGRAGNRRGSVSANEGHLCLLGLDAPPGDGVIDRVDLDADERAPEPLAGYADPAVAHERVQNRVARPCVELDEVLGKFDRLRRWVVIGLGNDLLDAMRETHHSPAG